MGSTTIRLRSELDVSGILNSIKQVRSELAKQGDSPLIGNLDREIAKIQNLGATIKAQMERGFSSSKELSAFESNMNKLELDVRKVGQSFDSINADNLKRIIKDVDNQVASLRQKATDLSKSLKLALNVETSNMGTTAKNLVAEITKMAQEGKSYEEVQKRILSVYEKQVKEEEKKTAEMEKQLTLAKSQEVKVEKSGFQRQRFTTSDGSQKLDDTQLKAVNTAYENAIKGAPSAKKAQKAFGEELERLGIKAKNVEGIMNRVSEAFLNYRNAVNKSNKNIDSLNNKLERQRANTAEVETESRLMVEALDRTRSEYNNVTIAANDANKAEAEGEKTKERAIEASKRQAAENAKVTATLNDQMNQEKKNVRVTDEQRQALDKLDQKFDRISNTIARYASFTFVFRTIRRLISETFADVEKLDKAFASIAMVTNKSVSDLWSSYDQYVAIANKLGQSTESAIKASALFYQQGLETADALKLTEDTMKLATLAGADFETATQQMTAALRGFHMEMDQGAHITDVYSELAAHAAADVNGIAYAMSKTASIAANAGMSFETTSALLAQMIETTQEAPENIGTAMKTIIARFTELKKNVSATESEFEDLDYNKVDTALKTVGINIKDATGQFRNLDDVFLELSSKWDTLDRNSQRYIATIAAGSRQQSRFIAMMENYERTMQLVNIAQDSAGRSNIQFSKYADTVEYRVNKLKNTWEAFRVSLGKSETFKKLLDLANNLLVVFTDLTATLPKFTMTLITVMTTVKALKLLVSTLKAGTSEFAKGYMQATGKSPAQNMGQQITAGGVQAANSMRRGIIEGGLQAAAEIRGALAGFGGAATTDITLSSSVEQAAATFATEINQAASYFSTTVDDAASTFTISVADAAATEEAGAWAETATEEAGAAAEVATEGAGAAAVNAENLAATQTENALRLHETEVECQMRLAAAQGESLSRTGASFASKAGGFVGKVLPAIMAVATIATLAMGFNSTRAAKKEEREKERREIYELATTNMKEKQSYSMAPYNKAQSDLTSLEDAVDAINTLSNRTYLSAKEQERLTTATELMNNQYPDLIDSFDENTGKMVLLTKKTDEAIKMQKDAVAAQKAIAAGRMGSAKANTIGAVGEQWGNQKVVGDSSIQRGFNDFGNNKNAQNGLIAGLAVTGGVVGGVKLGSVIGGAIGSVVPGLGTAIGAGIGAAAGALIGIGVSAWARSYAESHTDMTETLNMFSKLSSEAQRNIYEELSRQTGKQIDSQEKLEDWLEKSASKQEQFIGIVQDVLEDMRQEAVKEERHNATIVYLANEKYGKNEESISETFLRGFHDQSTTKYELKETDFEKAYSTSDIKDRNSKKLTKVIKKTDGGYDPMGKEKREEYEAMHTALENALGEDNQFIKWDLLSDEVKGALAQWGYTQDQYAKLEGQKIKDAYGSINENFYNKIVGDRLINTSKELKENLDKIVDSDYWPAIQELTDINKLASEYTPEEIRKKYDEVSEQLSGIVDNYSKYGFNSAEAAKDFVEQLRQGIYGKDSEGNNITDGASEIFDTYDAAKQLLKDIGFSDAITEGMNAEALMALNAVGETIMDSENAGVIVYALNKLMSDIPGNLDKKTAAAVKNYIAEQLTPDKFDVTRWNEYIEHLTLLTGDAEYAKNTISSLYNEWNSYDLLSPIKDIESYNEALKKVIETMKDAQSAFGDMLSSYKNSIGKNGMTVDDIDKLVAGGYGSAINEDGTIDLEKALETYRGKISSQLDEAKAIRESLKDDTLTAEQRIEKEQAYNAAIAAAQSMEKHAAQDLIDMEKELSKTRAEAEEKYNKALRDEQKQLRDIAKAEKEVQEAYHGSSTWNTSLGPMYNYETALSQITNAQELYNLELKDTTDLLSRVDVLNNKNAASHDKEVLLGAKSKAITEAMNDNENWLNQYSDFWYKSNGRYSFNYAYANSSDMPNKMRDEIARRLGEQNSYAEQNEAILKEKKQFDQDMLAEQKEYLNKYNNLLKEGANILKENAQEEVDTLKEKYESMKEADDEYYDALSEAIDRERKLRDMANAEEDLAQKEKKLSLLQRDTSGANAKETLQLQEEIEKDRQDNLDKQVDMLLEEMKKAAEDRAKEREALTENTEAIIESTEWTKLMKEQMSSWTSEDDAVAWLYANKKIDDITDEEIEQITNEWKAKYADGLSYLAQFNENYTGYIQATDQEIQTASQNIQNDLINASNNTTQKVIEDIEEAQLSADNALADAKDAYAELTRNIADYKESLLDANTAWDNYYKTHKEGAQKYATDLADWYEKELARIAKEKADTLYSETEDLGKHYTESYNKAPTGMEKSSITYAAEEKGYVWSEDKNGFIYNPTRASQIAASRRYVAPKTKTEELQELWNQLDTQSDPSQDMGVPVYQIAWNAQYRYTKDESVAKMWKENGASVQYDPNPMASGTGSGYGYNWQKYATGGLVPYTGIAQVDGTPSRPEAFLSAEDTERFLTAAQLFAMSPLLNSASAQNAVSSSIGDTSIEININVESISDDYDVDRLIKRVEDDINETARPVGTQVILNKRV